MLFIILVILAFAAGVAAGAGISRAIYRKKDFLDGYGKGYSAAIDYAIERIEIRKNSLQSK